VQSALMIVAGILALLHPGVSSVAAVLFLGWLLIISGIVQGISLIGARNVPGGAVLPFRLWPFSDSFGLRSQSSGFRGEAHVQRTSQNLRV